LSTQSSSPLTAAGTQPQSAGHAPEHEGQDQAQAAIIRRTVEVIGNESDAMRWLGTPVRALNYATPISFLHDPQGREKVLSVLGRIEHGIL
jgi:putative toxin-antitoxin system antitoxin component (TIGR02293 family)